MIFMGPLFQREQEKQLLSLSKAGLLNAGNTFQWNLIDGMCKNLTEGMQIINALPVGIWPTKFRKLILKSRRWMNNGAQSYEIGCINLPIIKQLTRAVNTKRVLKKSFANESEILLCTPYLPFLMALYHLPKSAKITAIITDLPEYSDMHSVSGIRSRIRKIHNKIVSHYLSRVDRFVLLTEPMKNPLNVGSRPYTVIEGVCSGSSTESDNINKNDDGIIRILYSGRLNYRYGIKTLLDAFEEITRSDIRLVICGSGEMEEEIRQAAIKDSRIEFRGYVTHDEILKIQKSSDILVNPRTNDGEYTKYSFPSKTMEYMASGVPVIMYKLDGVPDEYDEYLHYVKGNGTAALKVKLEEVCSLSCDERSDFGARARSFVINNKSPEIQGKKILDFISKAE